MLAVFAMSAAATARADNLFSNVSISSPFGGSSDNGGATPRQTAPQRLAGPASLSEMLRNGGLQPRELDAQVIAVKLQRDGGNLPVLITFTEDYNQLRLVMVLAVHKEGESISDKSLLGLLEANHVNNTAYFAYSKEQRRTELHKLIDNRSLTPQRLAGELNAMADIADRSKELWAIDTETPAAPPASTSVAANPKPAPQAKPVAKPAPAKTQGNSVLVGRWAASRSKTEAFALQINSNGTFALVTVVSGKTSQSTGNFTLTGNRLTLKDTKGTQISGTVTLSSAKEFKFLPAGAKSALTFKKPT